MKENIRLFLVFLLLSLLVQFSSVKYTIHNISVRSVLYPFLSLESLLEELLRIREERDSVLLEVSKLSEKLRILEERAIIELWERDSYRKDLLARILSFSPFNEPQEIVIDKGRGDGVDYGIPVISGQYLVGKIISARETTSVVETIYHPRTRIGVVVQRTGVIGLLEGGNIPKVIYVPNGADVRKGDTLYTSGIGRVYPTGIPVGVVDTIRKGEMFEEITVKPLLDLSRSAVVVVLNRKE